MADRKTRPSKDREQKLKQRYGITEAEYNAMLTRQRGRCGVCARFRKLVVDHNHKTGKVRGLLCSHCNSGLGFFEENTDTFKRAAKYLMEYS